MVEQGTENPCVVGSIPTQGTDNCIVKRYSFFYRFLLFAFKQTGILPGHDPDGFAKNVHIILYLVDGLPKQAVIVL